MSRAREQFRAKFGSLPILQWEKRSDGLFNLHLIGEVEGRTEIVDTMYGVEAWFDYEVERAENEFLQGVISSYSHPVDKIEQDDSDIAF
jgi:hypothetical protein